MKIVPQLTLVLALGAQSVIAATFEETFAINPADRGWQVFGDSSLFTWSRAREHLEVTWDSSRTNSFFHRPLGTVLTREDDFGLSFDVTLADIAIGTTPGKPFTFQIAAGFLRWADATNTAFLRGTGMDSPNVVEFDYFPDSGFGATVAPTLISRSNEFASGFSVPFELTTNDVFHIAMSYTAADQALRTTMTRNSAPFGPIMDARLGTNFSDFRVDHVAVCSYSDAGQDPRFGGSILAHGVVDNFVVTSPEPPIREFTGQYRDGEWEIAFTGRRAWDYVLERTRDFRTWSQVTRLTAPFDGRFTLRESIASQIPFAFYRLRAERP